MTGAGIAGPQHVDLSRPDAYGRVFDDVYDAWYGPQTGNGDLAAMVRFVSDRCPSRVVVELGVGSGRLAVPLHRAGVEVIGVDASPPMLSRCPSSIVRVVADMGRLPFRAAKRRLKVAPTFLCGFNTLFNLGSVAGLDRLLSTIAALEATLIVEMMNIDLLPTEQLHSTDIAPYPAENGIVISAASADVPNRRLAGRHLEITDDGVISRPWLLRLVGCDELDSRAERHGLRLVERYRSWQPEPFAASDPTSISVYCPSDCADPTGRSVDVLPAARVDPSVDHQEGGDHQMDELDRSY